MTLIEKMKLILKTNTEPEHLLSSEELQTYQRLLNAPAVRRFYESSQIRPKEVCLYLFLLERAIRETELSEKANAAVIESQKYELQTLRTENAALKRQLQHYEIMAGRHEEDFNSQFD